MKRGKAADIYVLTVEHLQYSHPVLSVLLSKFFLLITLCRSVPNGFKRSYIVPIPKVQDCQTKATSCDDFRGIVAVNRDQRPQVFELVHSFYFFAIYQHTLGSNIGRIDDHHTRLC